jgi:hypothetical protein
MTSLVESTMSELGGEQLVDFVLGLGTDHGLKDAVRAEPEGGSLRSLVSCPALDQVRAAFGR